MNDDPEYCEFDLPPGAQRAKTVGRGMLIAGGFAMLLCGGPLVGMPLLLGGGAIVLAGRFTWRLGSPYDLAAPLGCGVLGGGVGLGIGGVLTAMLVRFLSQN